MEKALATSLTGLALRVCWDGACKDYDVDLSPGSDTVDQGCDGNEPDAACSATAVPNGTLVGFVTVPALPAGEVLVGATLRKGDRTTRLAEVAVAGRHHLPERAAVRAGRQPGSGDHRPRRPALTVTVGEEPQPCWPQKTRSTTPRARRVTRR